MPYHYYKPRGSDECVTYIQNEHSRRGNHHRFITEKQVFARWAKRYNITFTHPTWWRLGNHEEVSQRAWMKNKTKPAGSYCNLPCTGLLTAPDQRQRLSGNDIKSFRTNKQKKWSGQMADVSENVESQFWDVCLVYIPKAAAVWQAVFCT